MCWRAVRNKSPALNDLYAPFLPPLDRMNSILRAGSLFETGYLTAEEFDAIIRPAAIVGLFSINSN